MVNRVILIGNLGKDPVIKHFSNESAIAEFSLATTEVYKDREGKWVELTDWHNIKLPTKGLAERAEKYLKKGSKVFLEGKIKTRTYDDKDGNKRYITEIVVESLRMLDKRDSSQSTDSGNHEAPQAEYQTNTHTQASDPNDDLPF